MRPTHHDRHAGGADCVGDAIGFLSHPRHRADPDKSDLLLAHKLNNLVIAHRAGVGINQGYLVTGRGDCLKQKHPEVRHEVARHPVVRVVQQNSHVEKIDG